MTRIAPSARLFATVRIVASTSLVRLSTVLAWMSGGSVRLISRIFASTAAATVRLFAPISISAVPTTTSSPFSLALPVRSSRPIATVATSRTWIGTPSRVPTTISPISSMLSMRPAGAHDVRLRRCARDSRRRG